MGGKPRGERTGGPSSAVAELTAAAEAEPLEPQPTEARPPWVKPIGTCVRQVTSELQAARYG
jgi:hypothetical protein